MGSADRETDHGTVGQLPLDGTAGRPESEWRLAIVAGILIHYPDLAHRVTEYHVVPSGNQWRLQQSGGSVVSNHRKKEPAVDAGKRKAGSGDSLVIHRADGTVQDRRDY